MSMYLSRRLAYTMSRMNHVNTHAEVIEAFRVFDKDGSGTISRDELYQILTDLGEYMDPKEVLASLLARLLACSCLLDRC